MTTAERADVFVDKVLDKLMAGWRIEKYPLPDGMLVQIFKTGSTRSNPGKPRQCTVMILEKFKEGMCRIFLREGRGSGPDDEEFMMHVRDSKKIADWLTE